MLTAEDEQFLKGVELIRKRSVITVGVVALGTVVFVLLGWMNLGLLPVLSLQEPQLAQVTLLLRAALVLFLGTVLAIAVGVLVLIVAYARQTKRLLGIIEQLQARNSSIGGA